MSSIRGKLGAVAAKYRVRCGITAAAEKSKHWCPSYVSAIVENQEIYSVQCRENKNGNLKHSAAASEENLGVGNVIKKQT